MTDRSAGSPSLLCERERARWSGRLVWWQFARIAVDPARTAEGVCEVFRRQQRVLFVRGGGGVLVPSAQPVKKRHFPYKMRCGLSETPGNCV